jgi:hypothetical protein
MRHRRQKTESDFEQIRCHECGKESGTFYLDTDDNETLCMDCVMNLPSLERIEFDRALEASRNWDLYRLPTGKVTLECVHCRENHPDLGYGHEDDDDFLIEMTDILEKDEEHECEEEEKTRKVIYQGVEYMVVSQTEDGEQAVIAPVSEGFPYLFDPGASLIVRSKDCEWLPNEED